ncbi:unnamed protein product [Mytilus edulis]|uniref:Uncharacterized protein n=1 Tax=Mytilus edulis TaxID=6550 RepID=A0A8S3SA27_MYTED|nr:unnamed protein product [Mytilus edulis]
MMVMNICTVSTEDWKLIFKVATEVQVVFTTSIWELARLIWTIVQHNSNNTNQTTLQIRHYKSLGCTKDRPVDSYECPVVQSSPVQLNENTYCYVPQNISSEPNTVTKMAVEHTTMAESVLQDKVTKLKQELTVTPKSTKKYLRSIVSALTKGTHPEL